METLVCLNDYYRLVWDTLGTQADVDQLNLKAEKPSFVVPNAK